MRGNRRDFMKWSGGAAVMAATVPAQAAAQSAGPQPRGMAKGLTLLQVVRDGATRLAVKTERGILDVGDASRMLGMAAPATLDDLLQNEDGPRLNALVDAVRKSPQAASLHVPETNLTYAPAVSRPGKIICVGLNYRAHSAEMGSAVPKQPILFNKFNTALHGHRQPLRLPVAVARKFDYEVELVIVMGKRAAAVSEADALSYVAGYCVGNDFTARDLQYETGGQWMIGKALDHFAPLGPYMLTADQVVDPANLNLECRVNGQTRQSSNTSRMIFNCNYLISYISAHITLDPGDIIYTGTPEGVINGMPEDKRIWLKAGDVVACSVEKLGELQFPLI